MIKEVMYLSQTFWNLPEFFLMFCYKSYGCFFSYGCADIDWDSMWHRTNNILVKILQNFL